MKKPICIVAAVALAAVAMAFHEGKPQGEKFRPEITESELQYQQQFQRTAGEVGTVQRDDDGESRMGPAPNDPGAAKILGSSKVDDMSSSNLREAEERVQKKSDVGTGFPIWTIFVGAAAFGCVYAVRQWANKNIPPPTVGTRVKW